MLTKYKIVPFCPYHFVHTILSNTILSVYHFVHTILSVPFCPLPFCPVTLRGAPSPGPGENKSFKELLKRAGQIPWKRADFRWETIPNRGTHNRKGPMLFHGCASIRDHKITSGGRAKRLSASAVFCDICYASLSLSFESLDSIIISNFHYYFQDGRPTRYYNRTTGERP